jgi:hypothetical protein
VRVVDAIALAQRVEVVLLAGVQILGHPQGVADPVAYGVHRGHVEQCEFGVQETDIERGVVDDQFGSAHEVEKLDGHIGKAWFVEQELPADAMHRQGAGIDITVRVQVAVEVPVGEPPIAHLDAGDLDDAMAELVFQPGGFRIEKYLAHRRCALGEPDDRSGAAGGATSAAVARKRAAVGGALQFIHAAIGESVGAFIAAVSGVPLDPAPLNAVFAGEFIEALPEVGVLHRLLVGGTPAVALPVVNPFADAFLQVLRIGVKTHAGWPLEGLQGTNRGGHFHTVVGGVRLRRPRVPSRVRPPAGRPPSRLGPDCHDSRRQRRW